MHTGMTSVDLQKVFHTLLDHKVLLEKRKYFGFQTSAIKWFESYLSNRKFLVSIYNIFSQAGRLKYGVPQASILGAPHFRLYLNAFPQSLSENGSYLQVGDTCIFHKLENGKKFKMF